MQRAAVRAVPVPEGGLAAATFPRVIYARAEKGVSTSKELHFSG